jgi:SET domain-containing protein
MLKKTNLEQYLKSYWYSRPALEPSRKQKRDLPINRIFGNPKSLISSKCSATTDKPSEYDPKSCVRNLGIETACLSMMSNFSACDPNNPNLKKKWPKVKLLPSHNVGYGVFAQETIEAGTCIGFYPGSLSAKPPKTEKRKNYSIAFSVPSASEGKCKRILSSIDTGAKLKDHAVSSLKTVYITAFDYVLPTVETTSVSPPMTWDLQNGFRSCVWYMNDDPFAANCIYQAEDEIDGFPKISIVTVRNIQKGEELLCNYGSIYFSKNSKLVPVRLTLCLLCRKRSSLKEVMRSKRCTFCNRRWITDTQNKKTAGISQVLG